MADQAILGLDIGTNRIKFVEARLGRNGPVIVNTGLGLTPRDTISNGVIVDSDVLGAAIRQLLDQHGVRTRRVVSSVASQSSLVVRPIEVPRMTRQELRDTMQWEVERHIPFAASEVIMDFQPLIPPEELPPEAQNMDVLLAVAQEDMIEAHVRTLFRAGLDPSALDVEPLCACRSLIDINQDQGAYEQTYAMLNIGASTSDLSIIRKGLLAFTRPMPLAGDTITTAIADTLGYELYEAERVKLEQGTLYLEGTTRALEAPKETEPIGPARLDLSDLEIPLAPPLLEGEEEPGATRIFDLGAETGPTIPLQEPPPPSRPLLPAVHAPGAGSPERQIYDAMLPTLVELVTEIRRSIDYYVNRFPEVHVDKVLLYGGTARLPNFVEFLGNEIAIEVEVGNPFARLEVDQGNISPEFVEENACFMPIVVGCAIRDMIE